MKFICGNKYCEEFHKSTQESESVPTCYTCKLPLQKAVKKYNENINKFRTSHTGVRIGHLTGLKPVRNAYQYISEGFVEENQKVTENIENPIRISKKLNSFNRLIKGTPIEVILNKYDQGIGLTDLEATIYSTVKRIKGILNESTKNDSI